MHAKSTAATILSVSGTLISVVPFTIAGTGQGAGTLYRAESGLAGSYASEKELELYSLPENVRFDFGDEKVQANLRRASREIDTFICHRFETVPLKLYSEAFVGWVTDLCTFFLMDVRGFKPGSDEEEARIIRKGKRAEQKARETQAYMITPAKELRVIEQPQPAVPYSFANRGWNRSVAASDAGPGGRFPRNG